MSEPYAIKLEGVTKTFGSKVAVRDLGMVVPRGSIVGFIGLHGIADIVWGIPLYSHIKDTHDDIVGKHGSYNNVSTCFAVVPRGGFEPPTP